MTEILTAISILVATLTWLITFLRDRRSQQIAHTADILANLSTSDRLAESSFQVTRLINAGNKVFLNGIDPKTETHIVDMLDYYEFLADLYANGVVNKKTVIEVRGKLMRRTWVICEPYIMETRSIQKRLVYSGFEKFIKELPPEH